MNYVQEIIDALATEMLAIDEYMVGELAENLIEEYALLVLLFGSNTTLKHVHDAWAVWRNRTKPEHKSLVEFDELTLEVQELDRKYMEVIHKVSRKFNR